MASGSAAAAAAETLNAAAVVVERRWWRRWDPATEGEAAVIGSDVNRLAQTRRDATEEGTGGTSASEAARTRTVPEAGTETDAAETAGAAETEHAGAYAAAQPQQHARSGTVTCHVGISFLDVRG